MFMYHDASAVVLLDLRRRSKAVGDLLHAVVRGGLLWLGLFSSQFSGMGSFGLGRFFLSLCRISVWLGVVVVGFGCR